MRTGRVSLHQNDARPALVRRVRVATTERLQDHLFISDLARSQEVMCDIQRTLE